MKHGIVTIDEGGAWRLPEDLERQSTADILDAMVLVRDHSSLAGRGKLRNALLWDLASVLKQRNEMRFTWPGHSTARPGEVAFKLPGRGGRGWIGIAKRPTHWGEPQLKEPEAPSGPRPAGAAIGGWRAGYPGGAYAFLRDGRAGDGRRYVPFKVRSHPFDPAEQARVNEEAMT